MKKISQINEDEIKIIADDFATSYENWESETAYNYLLSPFLISPEFCLKIEIDGAIAGGIFCRIAPLEKGTKILIDAIQILKEFRNQKMGTLLLEELLKVAKIAGITKIGLFAPTKDEFPISWYHKIGFTNTGWVELDSEIDNIKL